MKLSALVVVVVIACLVHANAEEPDFKTVVEKMSKGPDAGKMKEIMNKYKDMGADGISKICEEAKNLEGGKFKQAFEKFGSMGDTAKEQFVKAAKEMTNIFKDFKF